MLRIVLFACMALSAVSEPLYFRPQGLKDILCPDKQGTCPSGSTCCLLSSGMYGCCPLDQAVCCKDHLHCCPKGYKCNTQKGTCDHTAGGGISIPWTAKIPVTPAREGVVCPGGKSTCPAGSTCCKLQTGNYGCCPLVDATCCSDGTHCCPSGYTCNVAAGTCTKGVTSFAWKDVDVTKEEQPIGSVMCPDGQAECPDGSTCCELLSGQYGCCPMIQAVCCSDHLHCCPKGSKCDLQRSTCLHSNGMSTPWLEKSPAIIKKQSPVNADIDCPDGNSTCPSKTTCCKMLSGYYGCCPIPNAICCKDHLHCCASTQTCDIEKGICKDGDAEIPWGTKFPSTPLPGSLEPAQKVENIICPDKEGSCPTGSTCCKLNSGKYGCCPLEKATCCADHIHCCPSGYTCDTAQSTCNPKSGDGESIEWSVKVAAAPVDDIPCPGHAYSCPDGSTCCRTGSGWGCCPLPQATCCKDGAHCCPRGYHCNPSSSACFKRGEISDLTPVAIVPQGDGEGNGKCPDKKSTCPDGTTCCKLSTGDYGCCPFNNAVCCDDHVHCCPSGYTCDTEHGTCKQADVSVPWYAKLPAKELVTEGKVVKCKDNSTCASGYTCCKLFTGNYGCCPAPQAVCCNDGIHCCKANYTCNDNKCVKKVDSLLFSKGRENSVICPDQKSQCSDGFTCCKLKSGSWGCCPLPEAVCCKDGLHCCPKGTTCNTAQGRCDSTTNSLSVSWDTVRRSDAHSLKISATVACKDHSECPTGNTCCQLMSGRYGCCPLANATCCDDKVHCCPSGYKCDATATCVKEGSSLELPWWSHARTQALPPSSCCKNGGRNCCPSGATCNEATGECYESVPWLEKVPASPRGVKAESVMCPDKMHECPTGNTCCKLVSGEWGCCPLPLAVCCSDGQHCCPTGYKCDVEKGRCISPADSSTVSFMNVFKGP